MNDVISIDVREAVSGKNFSFTCEGISYFVYCTELSNDNGFEKKNPTSFDLSDIYYSNACTRI